MALTIRGALSAWLCTVLLLSGCGLVDATLAVPDEDQAVAVAERAYRDYVRFGSEFLASSDGDSSRLAAVVSPEILSSIRDAWQISRDRGIFVSGVLRVVDVQIDSVQRVGENWLVGLFVCLDYSAVVQVGKDGNVIAKNVRDKAVRNEVTIRVSSASGDARLTEENDSGVECEAA